MPLAPDLVASVGALLDGLDDDRRARASQPFVDDVRRDWAYWPTSRAGVALHDLDRRSTKAVHRLLADVLAEPAFARAVTIMGLDEVLDRREGYAGDRRHRDHYWFAVFGRPGAEPWGWRFEGHHVSVHVTVADGSVTATPLFLGANPAVVAEAGHVVIAPLGIEEELGFELLHALSVEERAGAVIADTAPDDIVTRNAPHIDTSLAGVGVPVPALRGAAATASAALLAVYLDRFGPGVRRPDPGDLRFAWAGASEPGVGHYYRLAGPRLLVELDNTQNGANHVHTVVRDPASDFGADLLADHHRSAHRG